MMETPPKFTEWGPFLRHVRAMLPRLIAATVVGTDWRKVAVVGAVGVVVLVCWLYEN